MQYDMNLLFTLTKYPQVQERLRCTACILYNDNEVIYDISKNRIYLNSFWWLNIKYLIDAKQDEKQFILIDYDGY